MPERDVLEPGDGARGRRGEPADPLRDDRVALVRHRGRALLPAAERLDLAHLGGRGAAARARTAPATPPAARARSAPRRAGRAAGSGSSSAPARARAARRRPARPRVGRRVRPDRARELADAHPSRACSIMRPVAGEREAPAGELEPERRRLGVDAVRAPDRDRPRCSSARATTAARARSSPSSTSAPAPDLERERGVEHVRGGQAVVEPAPVLAELLGHGVDEGRDVVVRARLDLRHALGVGATARARIASTVSRGTTPVSAHLRARPARRRASAAASLRPTRSPTWPGGSSAKSLVRV